MNNRKPKVKDADGKRLSMSTSEDKQNKEGKETKNPISKKAAQTHNPNRKTVFVSTENKETHETPSTGTLGRKSNHWTKTTGTVKTSNESPYLASKRKGKITSSDDDNTYLKKAISRRKVDPATEKEKEAFIKQFEAMVNGKNDSINPKRQTKFSSLMESGITDNPIQGHDIVQCDTLKKAIAPLLPLFPDLEEHAKIALEHIRKTMPNCENIEGSAAINLYTQEWDPPENSLYYVFNGLYRNNKWDTQKLKSFHPIINLMMSKLKTLELLNGTIYRYVNADLHKNYPPGSHHVWWSFTSCSSEVIGMEEFVEKNSLRTVFAIQTVRGRNISPFSCYPKESEVLLVPGTRLKVVSRVDLGGNLMLIQMEEIPTEMDLKIHLMEDKAAVEFWVEQSRESFTANLNNFCEALILLHNLPIKKKLEKDSPEIHKVAFQKFWLLWVFGGGNQKLLQEYEKLTPQEISKKNEDTKISLEKFGNLLSFGGFKKFLHELHSLACDGYLFTEATTGNNADALLKDKKPKGNNDAPWLLRCTNSRKETPFAISFLPPSGHRTLHMRIKYSKGDNYNNYYLLTGTRSIPAHSLYTLMKKIQNEEIEGFRFGTPVLNLALTEITKSLDTEEHPCYLAYGKQE